MIDYVEICIGETIIDHQSGQFMETMQYLETNGDALGSNLCVGRYDTPEVLGKDAVSITDIFIPLQFWFTKKLSSALPLISLSQQVKIVVQLKQFEELVTYDGSVVPDFQPILNSGVIVDYHMLGNLEEKKQFKEKSREYLIEQWQQVSFNVNNNTVTQKYELSPNLGYCVKELVFFVIENESISNNDYFHYGNREKSGKELIQNITFYLDSKERFEKLPESYYRLMIPQRYSTFAGDRNIYIIPFSEHPEMNQPSGTANFSRFDSVELQLDFIQNVPECQLYILAVSYNRLIISNKSVQLEFLT